MILKQVVHPTKPKLAECTGDINIIIKQEVRVVSGNLWKVEFSRQSSRRTLVGRRTRLKLAESIKGIKVIAKQEVWVTSCTFWGVKFSHHSWRRKHVLLRTPLKLSECTYDLNVIVKTWGMSSLRYFVKSVVLMSLITENIGSASYKI